MKILLKWINAYIMKNKKKRGKVMRKIAGESYVLKNLKSKKEKGITLIRLVKTITVLII